MAKASAKAKAATNSTATTATAKKTIVLPKKKIIRNAFHYYKLVDNLVLPPLAPLFILFYYYALTSLTNLIGYLSL